MGSRAELSWVRVGRQWPVVGEGSCMGVNAIQDMYSVKEKVEDKTPGTSTTLKGQLKGRIPQRRLRNERTHQHGVPSRCQKTRKEGLADSVECGRECRARLT